MPCQRRLSAAPSASLQRRMCAPGQSITAQVCGGYGGPSNRILCFKFVLHKQFGGGLTNHKLSDGMLSNCPRCLSGIVMCLPSGM